MLIEEAYQALADEAIERVGHLPWESIVIDVIIYESDTSSKCWAITQTGKVGTQIPTSMSTKSKSLNARFLLRDDLLRTTGHLCYGFTFTLFKDGQFDIQYRYDNPYKDIEEQIAAEQRNKGNT